MKNLQTINQTGIDNWNYDQSVKETAKKVAQHRRLSLEIVREVFIANEWFKWDGTQNLIPNAKNFLDVPNGTSRNVNEIKRESGEISFSTYLDEIGLPRRTAYNWLERFVPEENRLLSPEELKAAKQQKALDDWEAQQKRLDQFRDTGEKPVGWSAADDSAWMRDAGERALTMVEDPTSDIAMHKRANWERLFSARQKRKDDRWTQKELDFWELEDVEPVRSLARQLKTETGFRIETASALRESLKKWVPHDNEQFYLKSAIESLLAKLEGGNV